MKPYQFRLLALLGARDFVAGYVIYHFAFWSYLSYPNPLDFFIAWGGGVLMAAGGIMVWQNAGITSCAGARP